jgi:cytochrome c
MFPSQSSLRTFLAIFSSVAFATVRIFGEEPKPSETAFQKVVLEDHCSDPIQMAFAPDGRIFFVQRSGAVRVWKPDAKKTETAATLQVFYNIGSNPQKKAWEDGLLGVQLDPKFTENHWIYLYYSPVDVSENRLARFTVNGDTLDLASEKVLLRVGTQRDACCHSAGGLTFDAAGNLFLSTGDNTIGFECDGFAPLDFRPGRDLFDSARSAGNANDLRGKILRIHPEPDGTYTIPSGNLFPPGTEKARAEIYIMGCRNPFRFSYDNKTGILSWGDVGPDAAEALPTRGPAGFDEFNRAAKAGNYGWPFALADNKPYHHYDFATKTAGDAYDPKAPRNDSPNNTGLKDLPPAQPAFMWYPAGPSARFPVFGSGGRSACAGPVYHFDPNLKSKTKLPAYYDNTLFIYEWMRNWIVAVKLNDKGERVSMERFLPSMTFKHPTDLQLGPDGALYVIEFGTQWEQSKDSQLARIDFVGK